jgi:Uma2 family endonuclease
MSFISYEQTVPFYADAKRTSPGERIQLVEADFDYEHLITEDDEPVDNIFSEKQQRLLTESLYSSWSGENRSFLALANVGLFYDPTKQPLVPDVLVSLDVKMPDNVWQKQNRSYFVKQYGKPPEVVIEIVSNKKGKETGSKLKGYAKAGVRYYVVFDPEQQLKGGQLQVYKLQNNRYVETNELWLSEVQLGLTLWEGFYEDKHDVWLRWCDQNGNLISTGKEQIEQEIQEKEMERQEKEKALFLAKQERRQKEQAEKEAAQERQRALEERQRAERLAQLLREKGIDPDLLG